MLSDTCTHAASGTEQQDASKSQSHLKPSGIKTARINWTGGCALVDGVQVGAVNDAAGAIGRMEVVSEGRVDAWEERVSIC